jgi:hypothetical protein
MATSSAVRSTGGDDVENEVGNVYESSELGCFVVWDVQPTDDRALVYQCGTGELGRVNLQAFRDGVREGDVHQVSTVSELIKCPTCRSALHLVRDGQVDGEHVPFVSCTNCAFCEEL